jgi:hypothetical protein
VNKTVGIVTTVIVGAFALTASAQPVQKPTISWKVAGTEALGPNNQFTSVTLISNDGTMLRHCGSSYAANAAMACGPTLMIGN